MPTGKPYGYDGATKGEQSFNTSANRPTSVPTPTNVAANQKLNNKLPANHNSGIGRLQAYNKGRRGR